MKKPVVQYLFLLGLSLLIVNTANSQKIQKNEYGEVILTAEESRINYTYSEISNFLEAAKKTKPNMLQLAATESDILKDTILLASENIYTIMGTRIGRNSMHTVDLDNDGTLDLLCSASSAGFQGNTFWYTMNYNTEDKSYGHTWVSPTYENVINVIEVVDFNDDDNYSVLLGFENGDIHIYDGKTKKLINKVNISNAEINSIVYADANNNGSKELVVATEDKCYLLNPITLELEHTITQGANHIRVGDVNADSNNQIVLSSGNVYTLVNGVITYEWTFDTSSGGIIELCDIDSDGMDEVILAERWDYIKVFDVDIKSTKYTYNADLDIQSLFMYDANDDGIKDIIYGDGQWGDVVCVNSVTQQKIWSVRNPEHGVAAINVADLDGDGNDELIWTAGWTSTGEDYLYVYDLLNQETKWQSADVVGPFYALAIGDIDGDDKDEIVAVSYESESGYGSGIVFVFDAETKKIKWQSSGDFLGSVWTGVYDVAINDVDGDGQNDIIIAAGRTYTARIWVIDGKDYSIKSNRIFSSEDLDEFYSVHVDDLGDGKVQIVAANDGGVYFIDPISLGVSFQVNLGSYYYGAKPIIKCADVNADGQKEAILCYGTISVINTKDFSSWVAAGDNYLNIDTLDYNKDGAVDILASTKLGEIVIIDGATKAFLFQKKVEDNAISVVKAIPYNDSFIFIYSHNGRVNFYVDDENRYVSQRIGSTLGEYEGMQLFSANDTKMILGTQNSVIELGGSFLSCLSIDIDISTEDVSCVESDGKIEITAANDYTYEWDNGSVSNQIDGLEPGYYTVTITNQADCSLKKAISVEQAYIEAELIKSDINCNNNGTIDVNITKIKEPYDFTWSNSSSNLNLTNVDEGSYTLNITDNNNCTFTGTVNIETDTLIVDSQIYHNVCNGDTDGSILLHAISGEEPYTYNWALGETDRILYNLKAATYKVTVSDAGGCEEELELVVNEPDKISYTIAVSPDLSKTSSWDGAVLIESITGGTPPYNVEWPYFGLNVIYVNTLPAGSYPFIITDSNYCSVNDSAIITMDTSIDKLSIDDIITLYPNPVSNKLYIQEHEGVHEIEKMMLIDIVGREIINQELSIGINTIDLSDIKKGHYILKVLLANGDSYSKKIVKK